jgi:E3 ubiquitin-protein ligase ATL6/9/15/31/42/55
MVLSLVLITQSQENREKQQNMAELPQGVTPSKGVVIIVLSIMFLITFILLVYVKFCRVTPLHLLNHHPLHLQNNQAQTQSRSIVSGVEKKVIETLPFFKFSSLKGTKQGLECTVCLSKFEDEEILRLLPKCKHAFHMNCIDQWLESHSTCPLCRYMVEENDIKNFTFSFSSRFLRVPSNLGEDPNLEIFIQREPSQRRSNKEEQELGFLDYEEGGSSNNVTKWKQEQSLHMINHKILISDAVTRSRWSDLNSSDLLSLKSEMLHDVSSARFDPNDEDENSFTALNPGEKRSMSEIANVPRFVEINRRNGNGENGSDERLWRIWLPIARRTVQWFARQETNSVQSQHKHLANSNV